MMSRILPLIFLFLLAEFFNPILPDAQGQTSRQAELVEDPGVVSYTFRRQFSEDIPGTLDMIKDMGITNIEFSSLFGITAEEMRSLLDERGLICTSYGVGYNDLMYNDTRRIIEEAHILGADYVRVGSIAYDRPFTLVDANVAIEDFNRIGEILDENGLHFAYHNHGMEFQAYQGGTYFDHIVQNTNPDYVSFEMDVFWVAHPGHDPVALLEAYPDRFRLMHLKDLKHGAEHDYTGRADPSYNVTLGTGQIDFPGLMRAAANSSVEHIYIEDESMESVERVPVSLEYIKGLTE